MAKKKPAVKTRPPRSAPAKPSASTPEPAPAASSATESAPPAFVSDASGVVVPATIAVLAARMAHKGKADQPMVRVSVEDGRVIATDGVRLLVASEADSVDRDGSLFPDRGHVALVPAEDLLDAAHGKKVGHVRVVRGANEVHTLAMNGKRRRTTRYESLQGSKMDFPDWRKAVPAGRSVNFRANAKQLGNALLAMARGGAKFVAFHLGTIEQPLLVRGETDDGRQLDLVVAPVTRDGDKLASKAFGGDFTPVADPAKAATAPGQGELGKRGRKARR